MVDGRMCQLKMVRVATTANAWNYYRLTFSAARVRTIRFEHNGHHDFGGVVVGGSYSVFQRPSRDVHFRFVNIADSLGAGSPDYHYLRYDSFARLFAHAMGADSYVDLSFGGTGWSDAIPGNTFSHRVPRAVAFNPHMVGFFGSRNDYSHENSVPGGVRTAMNQVADVPLVVAAGPQQSGYGTLGDIVKQGLAEAGRTWIDLDGIAASPASNPTGHPTFEEHVAIAKSASAQVDHSHIWSVLTSTRAARKAPSITVSTTPSPTAAEGAEVTITATLSEAIPGRVVFCNGGVELSTAVVSDSTPSIATDELPIGTHSLTARFIPSDSLRHQSATSPTRSLTVTSTAGFSDNFNRADGPIGTSSGGKVWATTASGFVVDGNRAGNPTATSTRYATLDAETPDGVYRATLRGSFNVNAGLMLRFSDASNYVRLDWGGGSGNPRIYSVVSASIVTTITGSGGAWVDGDIVEVTLSGSSISVTRNATSIISGTVAEMLSATSFGINATSTSTGSYFDDLDFTP